MWNLFELFLSCFDFSRFVCFNFWGSNFYFLDIVYISRVVCHQKPFSEFSECIQLGAKIFLEHFLIIYRDTFNISLFSGAAAPVVLRIVGSHLAFKDRTSA